MSMTYTYFSPLVFFSSDSVSSKSSLFYCFNNSYSLSSNGLRMHECVCLCIHWHSMEWTDNMYTDVVHTSSSPPPPHTPHTHHLKGANRRGKSGHCSVKTQGTDRDHLLNRHRCRTCYALTEQSPVLDREKFHRASQTAIWMFCCCCCSVVDFCCDSAPPPTLCTVLPCQCLILCVLPQDC